MKRTEIITIAIVLLSFIISIFFYPRLPERVASHWNAQGQVDGYMSRFWGVFLLPFMMVGLFFLFRLIPRIDPLKANIARFQSYYDGFVMIIMAYFLYIHLLILLWNVGVQLDLMRLLAPAFAMLIYGAGVMMGQVKRNYFIGIRTPWTLSSDTVWEKTHQVGAKTFKVAGVIALLGVLSQRYAIWFFLIPVILAALYPVVYSYIAYQEEASA